jgi:hypothetical protein
MEAPQAHCNFCGKHLVMGEILYTNDARVACLECNRKVDMLATEVNVGGNILKAAIFAISAGGLGLLILVLPFSASIPFLLFALTLAIASLWSAVHALRSVNQKGDERFTKHVQQHRGAIYACSIIGIVLSGLVLISIALAFVAIAAKPNVQQYEYEYRGR